MPVGEGAWGGGGAQTPGLGPSAARGECGGKRRRRRCSMSWKEPKGIGCPLTSLCIEARMVAQ
jgi:hypothetical protein